jgi:asparagine synthase (glutamine-hydrolysing)
MCGFAGIVNTTKLNMSNDVQSMSEKISHRGPDHNGDYFSCDDGIFLSHRRLSILDLSSNANQPFISSDKNSILCFNGEIYNHLELKKKYLCGHDINWITHSDTETLLYLIKYLGIEKTLKIIDGMFSFLYIDSVGKTISFARDIFGEKPLYLYFDQQHLAFSSELKCLEGLNFISYEIDNYAVSMYKNYGYINAPNTIYKKIKKLEPGQYLSFSFSEQKIKKITDFLFFDKLSESEKNIKQNDDTSIELDLLISESVKSRMLSDVPVGSFLSGGIDSTLISLFAQRNSMKRINTFTIGFEESKFDESSYAREISKYLGTNHHEMIVRPQDFLDYVDRLPTIYDEPFADPSQLPMLFLSKFASESNKVCLSGDGGDELFSGYDRYRKLPKLWKFLSTLSLTKSPKIGNLIKKFDQRTLNIFFGQGYAIHRLADLAKAKNFNEFFDIARAYPNGQCMHKFSEVSNNNLLMRLMDLDSFLPSDVLTKVDIASMYNSLEVRSPFLNKNLFHYGLNIKSTNLMNSEFGKLPLRNLLTKYIPERLHKRPKSGFSVPIGSWLKNELYEWANSLINDPKINNHKYYDMSYIRSIWIKHKENRGDFRLELWNYLVFQNWLNVKGLGAY